ncbi:uncharacterized protein [Physcomitrium patens]|uniref:uncharacterized protein isoform X2 n=1 Tax=Physcomitrium patens TaxID=3218 RepID=UPI003CCE0EBA
MFTPNGKLHCKRDSAVHLDSGPIEVSSLHLDPNRGYNEDPLGRQSMRASHSSEPNVNCDGDHFDRRLPPQSSGNREYEECHNQEHRKVRFRNGGRSMCRSKDTLTRNSGIRNGGCFDDGISSVSSDQRCGCLPGPPNETLDYVLTPPERKTTPDFINTPPEYKSSSNFIKASPEYAKGHAGHFSHGNQLLNLRVALNEKELQLVELREQHITLLNRATDARQNWEEALKSKDRVILQLNRTLQHMKSQLDRQERENQENLHTLKKRQKEENAEAEKKDHKVALLEAKNAQFVQELVEQQKLITRMKRRIDDKENLCSSQFQKLEMMNGRVQDLKAALQEKEEEANMQSNYCKEVKTLLWKRDAIIAQLQLSEQQLQSSLAREEAAREALEVSRNKVQDEKILVEKRLSEMHNQIKALESGDSCDGQQRGQHRSETRKLMELKDDFSNVQEGALKDLDDREGVMHRIQKRMRELQRSLRSKDNALSNKNNEYRQALQEIERLTKEYEGLKQEFEDVNKRNDELETALAQLQDYTDGRMAASISEALTPPVEVLPYEFSQGGASGEGFCTGDLRIDDILLDGVGSEQLSNASVYHANFEKIQIIEVEMPDICSQQRQVLPKQEQHEQQEQQKSQATSKHLHHSFDPPPLSVQTLPPAGPSAPEQLQPTAAQPRVLSPLEPPRNVEGCCSELDAKYNSIQDEILKREQCWRKTEGLMRAALTRRMKLLEESTEVNTSEPGVTWSTQTGLKVHDISGNYHNLEKAKLEQVDHTERRKQMYDENCLNHYMSQRKVSREDGHKYHAPDSSRGQRQNYGHNNEHGRRINKDVDHCKKMDNPNHRRWHEEGVTLDWRKSADRNAQLEDCKVSEHYGHYERNGQSGRNIRKGRFP